MPKLLNTLQDRPESLDFTLITVTSSQQYYEQPCNSHGVLSSVSAFRASETFISRNGPF